LEIYIGEAHNPFNATDNPTFPEGTIMTTLVSTHGGLGRVDGKGRAKAAKARGPVAGWIARWVKSYQIRQQERAFEALMQFDPRVRAEVDAAAARASWDR